MKKGRYWVDMDIVCIKPFDFDIAQGLIFGMEKENLAGVSILGGFAGFLSVGGFGFFQNTIDSPGKRGIYS